MEAIAVAAGTFPDLASGQLTVDGLELEVRVVSIDEPASLPPLSGCRGLVVGLHRLTDAHFQALPPSIAVIGRAGIGLDSIDLDAADRHGVGVVHQPDYATDEVATHAVALMLALSQRIVLADRLARTSWPSWSEFLSIRPLSQSTVAVIGLGRIGQTVASRLLPLAARVVGYDPESRAEGVIQAATLDEALDMADIVSLHAPLTEQTTAMIDAAAIERLPHGALLVNVARGGLIDEAALARALHSGRVGGAALDVLAAEPPLEDNPLFLTPNTVLTPHMAWISQPSRARLQEWTLKSILEVLEGRAVAHGRIAVPSRRRS